MTHGLCLITLIALCAPPTLPQTAPNKNDGKIGDRILRARETVEQTKKGMAKVQAALDDPDGEYFRAKDEYSTTQKALQIEQEAIKKLRDEGQADEAAQREAKLPPLKESLEESRSRYNLAIQKRKAQQDALMAMKRRLELEEAELDRLEGRAPPAKTPPTTPQPQPQPTPAPPAGMPKEGTPSLPPIAPLPTPAPTPPPATPGTNGSNGVARAIENSKEARQAREELDERLKAVQEAEQNKQNVQERIDTLMEAIQAANRLMQTERQISDQASQQLAQHTTRLQKLPANMAEERKLLADRIAEASRRLEESRERIRTLTDRLATLNAELHHLEQDRLTAMQEMEQRKAEAEVASQKLQEITNPFTFRNLLHWFSIHGPNLLIITIVTALLYLIARTVSAYIIRWVSEASNRGGAEDRENRANTLTGVFRYVSALFIIGGGLVMLLDEAGVPIVPLMGGAAVVGLAVAFGAQNLIKDYFSGFMLLMEDQYGVNDVVRIGDTAGTVELITLRVTVLRDLEGVRHFIPHGSITKVSNLTHTWSRALFDIPIAYGEDVDRAMKILMELAREMRSDPTYGMFILEEPEMLGVNAFDSSAVVIRFVMKTRPIRQWMIKREMLRRIKNRFDAENIEIPFPHRTVYHRFPDTELGQSRLIDPREFRKSG